MIGFDREALTEQVLQDGSVPAYGYVPPAITPGPGNQTFRQANGDLVPKDVEFGAGSSGRRASRRLVRSPS